MHTICISLTLWTADKAMLWRLFVNSLSEKQFVFVFNAFDKAKKGSVDVDDFVHCLSIICRGTPTAK